LHGVLSRQLLLITVTGRRSGRRYTLPVQYVRRDDVIYILPGSAASKTWWHNLTSGAPVTLRVQGRMQEGDGEALKGAAAQEALGVFAGTALERAAHNDQEAVVVRVRNIRLLTERRAS
jgi:deazaflavin-dependent oxidoreductase (nitroreductase family)